MLLPTKLHLFLSSSFNCPPPRVCVRKDTTRLKQDWIPGHRARRNMRVTKCFVAQGFRPNIHRSKLCMPSLRAYLDLITGAQNTAQAFEGDSRAEKKVAIFQASAEQGHFQATRAHKYCTFESWDRVLPVGHPGFVERHEIDLGGGSAFDGRKENFVVSFAQKLEFLRSFVHEDPVQVARVQRPKGEKEDKK